MQAVVVDPALAGEDLLGLAEKHGAKIAVVLNTHGHPDPTADDESIRKATGAKIAIFELDAPRLEKNARESRWFLPAPPPSVKPDLLLKEGSEIKVGDLTFRTLHTHGRTDTFGGSPAKMVFSLRRLKDLPPTTRLYPGHGPETILGDESWLTDVMYPIL